MCSYKTDLISCLTQCLKASHPSLREYDCESSKRSGSITRWTRQKRKLFHSNSKCDSYIYRCWWFTFNPLCIRSLIMAINSLSDSRPSPSSSKSKKTVRTTCWLREEPVQILTALWNSSTPKLFIGTFFFLYMEIMWVMSFIDLYVAMILFLKIDFCFYPLI